MLCKSLLKRCASCMQGDPGDLFYVIKEGEASVYQVLCRDGAAGLAVVMHQEGGGSFAVFGQFRNART